MLLNSPRRTASHFGLRRWRGIKGVDLLPLIFLLLLSSPLFAQYAGGPGDGYASDELTNVSLSLDETSFSNGFMVFPNPFNASQHTSLQFRLPPDIRRQAVVRLIALNGNEILKMPLDGTLTLTLPEDLAPGLYAITVHGESYFGRRKLLVE